MLNLSGDPYEGAYCAFLFLNPSATGDDWERWVAQRTSDSYRDFDNFAALAEICGEAARVTVDLSEDYRDLFVYAQGYFEAMEGVLCMLCYGQHTSTHVPKHYTRHHRS